VKVLPFIMPLLAYGANYTADKSVANGIPIVRLGDAARRTQVSIVPSIGNTAFEMKVNGKNLLWFPFPDLAQWKAKPIPSGIPFLGPWGGRLDEDAFWANGRKYILNPGLGNLRRDQFNLSIHGTLYFSPYWELVELKADAKSARAVSRLEYWKHPDLVAQFPIAHTLTMTHRLADGVLEVELGIENHSVSPMPLCVGFHPFFQLHDSPRADWTVRLPARQKVVLNDRLLPAGEWVKSPYTGPQPLRTVKLDDILTDLERGLDGRSVCWVQGKREKISVSFGPGFPVAVAFTPPDKEAVCLEPMTAIGNAFNAAQKGWYKGLQSIPPGGTWKENFRIIPEGF
jgi:aldose 1-epimerase